MKDRRERRRAALPIVLLAALLAAGLATASDIEANGSVRVRHQTTSNHDFDGDSDDGTNATTMRTRIGFTAAVGQYGSAFVQLQDSRSFGEEPSTLSSIDRIDLHQGYLQIRNAFDSPLGLRFGRTELAYGGQRQVGPVGWSDVGRSFDGALATFDVEDFGWVHAFATKTAERDGVSDPADHESAFLGVVLHHDVGARSGVEAYVFDVVRDNGVVADGGAELDTGHVLTFGGRAVYAPEGERHLKLYAEAAMQRGTTAETDDGGTAAVPGLDVSSHAFVAGGELGLPTDVDLRLFGEFNLASGDDDPSDDEIQTYQQLFPTPHAPLGYMDFVGWQNVTHYQAGLKLRANDAWSFWGSFHAFWLTEPGDAWYRANGSAALAGDPEFDSELGREIDLSTRFSPEPGLNFEAHLLFWMPGSWQEQATALAAGAADAAAAIADPADLDGAWTLFLLSSLSF